MKTAIFTVLLVLLQISGYGQAVSKYGSTSTVVTVLSQVERDALAAPADGLIIYCSDCENVGLQSYSIAGPSWIPSNSAQNIENVLIEGNNANGRDLVNTGKIGIGIATPNVQSSLEIATPLPVIFPAMNQQEINSIAEPVEGMVQFNETVHKLQVYAKQTTNTSILNELYIGAELSNSDIFQEIISPIDGQITAIELLLKNGRDYPGPQQISYDFDQFWTVPEYNSFTWFTMQLDNSIPVTAGQSKLLRFFYAFQFTFATNSNYPNGSCSQATNSTPSPQDDVAFRVHIQPNSNTDGWQNMH